MLPVSSAFEFFSGYGRDMSVWVASAVSFLCAVKRDKGGRASADDSSKEERVRGHDAASLCQGLMELYLRTIEYLHVVCAFC